MSRLLSKGFRHHRIRKHANRRRRRLLVEQLESRELLAVDTWQIALDGKGNVDLFGPFAGGELQKAFAGEVAGPFGPIGTSNLLGGNNAPPTAVDDDFSATPTDEDSLLTVLANGLLANDSDLEMDPINVVAEVVSSTLGAVVSLNEDGGFTYDPSSAPALQALSAGSSTNDSFRYQLRDARGGVSVATATVLVSGVNDAPTANDDSLSTTEDSSVTGDVTADNASGADGDPDNPIAVTRIDGAGFTAGTPVTLASGALLTMNTDGTFAYDPNGQFEGLDAGQTGSDSFTYTIDDALAPPSTATVSITINGRNDRPVAADDAVAANEDTGLVGGNVLLDNGFGPDADIDAGSSISVTRVNGASFTPGTPFALPSGAVLTISDDGSFDYDPNGSFEALNVGQTAEDSFSYRIDDGQGHPDSTDTAVVTVTINGANDAPSLSLDANTSGGASPNFAAVFDSNLPLPVNIVDVDPDLTDVDDSTVVSLTVAITNRPDGVDETLAATPSGSITAGDISFDAAAGVLTIAPSVAASFADYEQVLRSITYTNASVIPTIGVDRLITFVASDGTADSAVRTSTVSVLPISPGLSVDLDASAAGNGFLTSFVESGVAPGSGPVPVVDTDVAINSPRPLVQARVTLANAPDGVLEGLSVNTAGLPAGITVDAGSTSSTVILNSGGSSAADFQTALRQVTYDNSSDTPDTTARTINVVLEDLGGESSGTSQATVSVTPGNDAPSVSALTFGPIDGDPFTVNAAGGLLSNATDPESQPLAVSSFDAVSANGGAISGVDLSTGAFTYTALATFSGTDTFDFTVTDGNGGFDTATVTITVSERVPDLTIDADNSGGFAPDFSASFDINLPVAVNIADSDLEITDPDSPTLASAVVAITNRQDGSDERLTAAPAGSIGAGEISFDAASGTLTISPSGGAPVADFEQVLRSVTYENTAVVPTTGIDRNVTFVVNDGGRNSPVRTSAVSVLPISPGLSLDLDASAAGSGYSASFVEAGVGPGSGAVAVVDSDVSINAPRSLVAAVITLTDRPDGADEGLVVNAGGLPGGIALDAASTATNVILTSAGATAAEFEAALGQIRYDNASDTPDTTSRSVTISLEDNSGGFSNLAVAAIAVVASNDGPVASDDGFVGSEDSVASGDVLADNGGGPDTDADGAVTVSRVNGNPFTAGTPFAIPSGALLTMNSDGTFDYDPNGQFEYLAMGESATDTFTYTIDDGQGQGNSSATATVQITINGSNDQPLAQNDAVAVAEDGVLTDSVLLDNGSGADADPDGNDTLQVTRINGAAFTSGSPITLPSGAVLTMNASGGFDYDPNGQYADLSLGETATDNFTYTVDDGRGQANSSDTATVTITIDGRNAAPLAADDSISTDEESAVAGNLLSDNGSGADADPDTGDTLTVTRINGAGFTVGVPFALPSGAQLTVNADGSFSYDPDGQYEQVALGETANDSFSYTVDDGRGQANSTDTATVTVTINGLNDGPTARDDAAAVTEDGLISSASVLSDNGSGADSDPDTSDTLTVSEVNGGAFVPGSPITLPSGALLTMDSAGNYDYDPNGQFSALAAGETASDTFTYTIDDGRGQPNSGDTATVTITINGGNNAPDARDDAVSTDEDTAVAGVGLLLDNGFGADTDPDTNDTLTVTRINGLAFTPGASIALALGTLLTVSSDGTFDYDPNGQFEHLAVGETATDTFTYTLDDGRGEPNSTDVATVTITVSGRNDAPVAASDAVSTDEDSPVAGNLLSDNGSGADGDVDSSDTLSVTQINGASYTAGVPFALPSGALLTMNANGTFSYDPNGQYESLAAGDSTTDSFSYTLDDGRGQANSTDTATVLVTIDGLDEAGQATSASFNGVTFTFDRPLTVGHFVTGEPWVVSSEPFEIISISPDSQVLDGAVAHGAMKDPYVDQEQGFDEFIANSTVGGMRFGNTAYNAALNVDPGVTGSSITIGAGEETSIVKSVRLPSVTDPENWQTIEKYVPLHVLASPPPANAYPPSSSALTKQIWSRNDINESVLRSLSMPASFGANYATASPLIPRDLGLYGSNGEQLRRFRLDVTTGASTSNYSANVARPYVDYMMLMHDSTVSASDRQAIIDDVVRHAIQIHGLTTRGFDMTTVGAGQGFAVHPWLYYGAFLLNDQAMLNSAQAMGSTAVSFAQWMTASDVGTPAPGKSGANAQTFFDEHVGLPFIIPDEWGSNHDTRYGVIAQSTSAIELMAIQLLQNGPGGVSGTEALLDGEPFDSTSQRAASLAHIDRVMTFQPWPSGAWDLTEKYRDIYGLTQPLSGLTPWSGRPDQIPIDALSVTGGDGSLSWNLSGIDYATETVTQKDFRYSLDGIQWVVVPNISDADSVTGLMRGVDHYTGFRQTSASGSGLWSLNYPRDMPIDSGNDRGVVATTGSGTATAPSFTVTPAIHYRQHPAWDGPSWAPAPGTLAAEQVELACGVGYLDAYPAPTFSYQWLRDGANIAGATGQTYTRTAADAGAVISCQVTATNLSGSASATSAGVTSPPLSVLPSSTLIDTDFGGSFAIDYETELANVTETNAVAVHQPTQSLGGLSGVNVGALLADKTSARPSIELPLQNPAIAGRTYSVAGQFVLTGTNARWTIVAIRNSAGTTLFEERILEEDYTDFPMVVNFAGEIVVPAGETDLNWSVYTFVDTGTGGTSNGDLYLTSLNVVAQ